MKPDEIQYIGDGAYLHFDGWGFELRANDPTNPTDRVYIEGSCVRTLIRLLRETIEPETQKETA
jgi:hypothetical protein